MVSPPLPRGGHAGASLPGDSAHAPDTTAKAGPEGPKHEAWGPGDCYLWGETDPG